jgi:hypothetical protein
MREIGSVYARVRACVTYSGFILLIEPKRVRKLESHLMLGRGFVEVKALCDVLILPASNLLAYLLFLLLCE